MGLEVKVATPVYAFEDVDEVVVDVMGVEVGVVFVCADEEVFGKGTGTKSEQGVGQGEDFLGLAFAVRDVAFGADGDEEGVNTCGVDSVDGFEARDFYRYHWASDVVNEVAKSRVFLGWSPDDSEGPDGVFAMVDVFDVEDGEFVGETVIAEVIAKGTFEFGFTRVDGAGDDEVGFGGNDVVILVGVTKSASGQGSSKDEFGETLG